MFGPVTPLKCVVSGSAAQVSIVTNVTVADTRSVLLLDCPSDHKNPTSLPAQSLNWIEPGAGHTLTMPNGVAP